MSIKFRERPTMEHVFQLEVRKAGALLGHVRRDAKGFYQYYRGPLNQLMYEFEDDDLDRMKKRITSTFTTHGKGPVFPCASHRQPSHHRIRGVWVTALASCHPNAP